MNKTTKTNKRKSKNGNKNKNKAQNKNKSESKNKSENKNKNKSENNGFQTADTFYYLSIHHSVAAQTVYDLRSTDAALGNAVE